MENLDSLKDKINLLRSEGKSYKQIQKILNCSKSTINWHLTKDSNSRIKVRLRNRIQKFHKKVNKNYKVSFDLENLYQKFGSKTKCYITGMEIDLNDIDSFELDHIIPISKGGDANINNLGIVNKNANRMKSDLSLSELISMCKMVLVNHGYVVQKNA